MSANVSYERCAQDLPILTGMAVSRGTQQRLVHRQAFPLPQVDKEVEEMSIDGGKVRLRTPKGKICRWQDYKAVNFHDHCCAAFLQDNEQLVGWVNQQLLANPVTCLGDGHDGIWNLCKIAQSSGSCPFLVKRKIALAASKFLNSTRQNQPLRQ